MADSADKLQQVKSMLRSVLLSVKEGVKAAGLQRDYEDIVGEVIPFRQLGFASFEQFILSIPDVVRIERRGGDVTCHGVHDESTAHIKKLVSKQRSKKIKKPARRPRGGGSAKFISRAPRRPPPQHVPKTPIHHGPRHGIPSFISPPPNINSLTPFTISIGNTRSSSSGRVIKVGNSALLSRAMSDANNQDRTMRRPSPAAASRFEVPPRFKKMQGGSSPPQQHQAHSNTPFKRPQRTKTEGATIEDGDTYIESLQQYLRENNLPMQFETLKMGAGFVSSIKVNDGTFGSEDIFRTGAEAEAAAARTALNSIKQNKLPESRLQPIDWNETAYVETGKSDLSSEQLNKIRSRVKAILDDKVNGLWNTRIPHLYKENYNEEPPPDLLDLIKDWTDMAKVEPIPNTNREIVYPVKEDPCMNLQIPKTLLVNYGEKVTVYMTFIYHPGYFFVQREDSVIDDITELLQKHCKSTTAPPAAMLQKGRYCAGIFSEDGQWTRAEILRNKNDGTVELLFVDYGNVECVKTQDTRWLSPELAKHSYQALNCCLYGVQSLEGESGWSDAAIEKFANMVQDEELIAVPENLCDGIVEVQLYMKSNQSQSISERLAADKLAQTLVPQQVEDDDNLHPVDLQLPDDKEWDVHVTYISTSLMSVMLRLVGEEYSEKLDAYQAKLEEAFRGCSSEAPIQEGVTYIAYDDDLFHRVRMISEKEGKVECYFLDHGDTDELLPEQLHPIDPQINKLLPYQAVEVSMYGLEDVATNMTALEQMCDLALGKSCVAEIVVREDIPSIILYDTSGEKDININDTILAQVTGDGAKNMNDNASALGDVNLQKPVDNTGEGLRQNRVANTDSLSVDNLNERLQMSSLSGSDSGGQPLAQNLVMNQSLDSAQHSSLEKLSQIPSVVTKSNNNNIDSTASRPILGRSTSSQDNVIQSYVIPDIGEYFDVHVNFVRDPSNFQCIPYSEMNQLNQLLMDMLDFYSVNKTQMNKDDIKLGQFYAGLKDMVWFRVKIHSFVGTDLVSVYQVDIGEYCVMMLTELQPLMKHFCELPAMAFNASLGKISPKSGSWFEAAKYKFIELAQEKDLIGLVLGHDKTSGAVELRLIDTSDADYDVCIDEVLVKMGFAKFV